MANSVGRQFKHPIQQNVRSVNNTSVGVITPEEVFASTKVNNGLTMIKYGSGLQVAIKYFIGATDVSKFTSLVLDLCWYEESYRVEYLDFAFRCAVIAFYSNVKLPDKLDAKYDLVYGTDLYDSIYNNANSGQIGSLYDEIKMYILSL